MRTWKHTKWWIRLSHRWHNRRVIFCTLLGLGQEKQLLKDEEINMVQGMGPGRVHAFNMKTQTTWFDKCDLSGNFRPNHSDFNSGLACWPNLGQDPSWNGLDTTRERCTNVFVSHQLMVNFMGGANGYYCTDFIGASNVRTSVDLCNLQGLRD